MTAKRARWLFNSAFYQSGEPENMTTFGAVMTAMGVDYLHREDAASARIAAQGLREWADALEGKSIDQIQALKDLAGLYEKTMGEVDPKIKEYWNARALIDKLDEDIPF